MHQPTLYQCVPGDVFQSHGVESLQCTCMSASRPHDHKRKYLSLKSYSIKISQILLDTLFSRFVDNMNNL